MPEADRSAAHIYHLALADDWQHVVDSGENYRISSGPSGLTLEDAGFIHGSFAHQAQGTADKHFEGHDNVVLLVIDPARLDAEVRYEDLHGGGEDFPHIYGEISTNAVVEVVPVKRGEDGQLNVDAAITAR